MGDASDGYSGVSGIGEKTALKLIQTHGSVDTLLDNLNTLTPKMQYRHGSRDNIADKTLNSQIQC